MAKVMEEVHLTTIKPRNNVLLLAQEISFAKVLACNDKRLRDRGLRRLKKWFMARSQGSIDFTKDDHLRIWKGLFYCMWMADKPLVQEDLAEEISQLVHSFASFNASLLFVETFFTSLSIEWFGIDQLRLDKFMMLIRRFMRQCFELVGRIGWPQDEVQKLADMYLNTLNTAPMGLSMHIIEVFCEELAKVGKGDLSSATILQLVGVFARFMGTLKDGRLISQITRYVFLHLIRQTELGIEHQMKFSAWKEYGFPGGDLDAAEKVEVDSESEDEISAGSGAEEEREEEEREIGVDARAGKVDVLLPPLDFDTKDMLQVLREVRNMKDTTTKSRKTLMQLISKFENLSAGKYPLGLHKVDVRNNGSKKKEIGEAAKRLIVHERKLIDNEEDDSEDDGQNSLYSKKILKKKKAMKTKRLAWRVSKVDDSNEGETDKKPEANASWEVTKVTETNKISPANTKKRKQNRELKSVQSTPQPQTKKAKMSEFSVIDSKENSFSSPVSSTPISSNCKRVLAKTTSNSQNIQNGSAKKLKKQKKTISNNTDEESTPTIPELKEVESETTGTLVGTKKSVKKAKDGTVEKTLEPVLNISTNTKNNGWGGGEWEEPLKEGEYEIFIPNKKYVAKKKSLGLPYPVSSFIEKSAEKKTPIRNFKNGLRSQSSTPGSGKRVEFNLSANRSQDYREYAQTVKSTKKQVPFDSSKKPSQGLLKNSTPSPINPFYKKKHKLFSSPGFA